jgi:hypothetical protein
MNPLHIATSVALRLRSACALADESAEVGTMNNEQ